MLVDYKFRHIRDEGVGTLSARVAFYRGELVTVQEDGVSKTKYRRIAAIKTEAVSIPGTINDLRIEMDQKLLSDTDLSSIGQPITQQRRRRV